MSRVLVVTWDGAGNLLPTMGLIDELTERGHDVRVLGQASMRERMEAKDWAFRPLVHTDAFDWTSVSGDELAVMVPALWFNPDVARDVAEELAREPVDVVISDCMLPGAMCAGMAAGVPTVALFHAAYTLFRGGPMVEVMAAFTPALNEMRASMGQAPVSVIGEIHDECALGVVFAPREFEPPVPAAANARWVGPALEGPPLDNGVDEVQVSDGPLPLVVVSFSTSDMDQVGLLQQTLDALASLPVRVVATTGPAVNPASLQAPANAQVVQFVPHERVVPHASLVVTHAGMGTVMRSLAHGVPMVCIPMGRDQFFNAGQVEAVGAGRVVMPDAGVDGIRAAVTEVLDDDAIADGAKVMANVIASYRGAADAADHIEGLTG